MCTRDCVCEFDQSNVIQKLKELFVIGNIGLTLEGKMETKGSGGNDRLVEESMILFDGFSKAFFSQCFCRSIMSSSTQLYTPLTEAGKLTNTEALIICFASRFSVVIVAFTTFDAFDF